MFSSQKILWTVFIILFVVAASELFYIFYYQPSISQKIPLPTPIPSVSVKSNNIVGIPSIAKVESGQQIENILTEAKTQGRKFTSHISILNGLDQTQNCTAKTGKCFQLDNLKENSWKANADKDFPISISGSFIVRLNFNGTKGASGVDLTGRLGESDEMWWKNLNQIFFGIGEDGKRLYIDVKNNNSDPFILSDNTFDKKIDGIYILFNETGTSFLVTDLSYKEIAFIDLNKTTDNKFPEGLFPDKQFYIGYAIAPLSDLVVYDLSIL